MSRWAWASTRMFDGLRCAVNDQACMARARPQINRVRRPRCPTFSRRLPRSLTRRCLGLSARQLTAASTVLQRQVRPSIGAIPAVIEPGVCWGASTTRNLSHSRANALVERTRCPALVRSFDRHCRRAASSRSASQTVAMPRSPISRHQSVRPHRSRRPLRRRVPLTPRAKARG